MARKRDLFRVLRMTAIGRAFLGVECPVLAGSEIERLLTGKVSGHSAPPIISRESAGDTDYGSM